MVLSVYTYVQKKVNPTTQISDEVLSVLKNFRMCMFLNPPGYIFLSKYTSHAYKGADAWLVVAPISSFYSVFPLSFQTKQVCLFQRLSHQQQWAATLDMTWWHKTLFAKCIYILHVYSFVCRDTSILPSDKNYSKCSTLIYLNKLSALYLLEGGLLLRSHADIMMTDI